MTLHKLSAKEWGKAITAGIGTGLLLVAVMVPLMKTGHSPMPKPLGLAFARAVLQTKVPIIVGLLFHLAYVTVWSIVFVVLFRDRLSLARAAGLGLFLWILALIIFAPVVGWGVAGFAVSPKIILGLLVTHVLFVLFLWGLCRALFQHKIDRT